MSRQQRRKLLKNGEKIRKLRDQKFQDFLRESCLSAIGNMEPFKLFAIALEGKDSDEVNDIFAENATTNLIAFYQQNGEGKITKVSLSSGHDLTEEFEKIRKTALKQYECVNVPEAVFTFEVIKAFNFAIEDETKQDVGHVIFTDKSVAELKDYTNEIFAHYEHHYGSKKPIYLGVYTFQEAVTTWH